MIALGAVDLEIVKASLSGIVQEMQNSLFRTGFSTIVRESQDASCAILDTNADVIAQHVVLPLHMGAFPACGRAVLKATGTMYSPGASGVPLMDLPPLMMPGRRVRKSFASDCCCPVRVRSAVSITKTI